MPLAPLKIDICKQGASLYQLSQSIINMSDSHSVPDIISVVAKNFHVAIEYEMAEVDAVATLINENVFNVSNLYKTMFIYQNLQAHTL